MPINSNNILSKIRGREIAAGFAALIFSVLGNISCDNSENYIFLGNPYFEYPRATGLYLTDQDFHSFGEWGNPTKPPYNRPGINGSMGSYDFIIHAAPNPAIDSVIVDSEFRYHGISYAVDSLWITRLLGPDQDESETRNFGGADFQSSRPGETVATLEFITGRYRQFVWRCTDNNGNRVQAGFYRIHARAQLFTYFVDVLVLDNCDYIRYPIDVPICQQ